MLCTYKQPYYVWQRWLFRRVSRRDRPLRTTMECGEWGRTHFGGKTTKCKEVSFLVYLKKREETVGQRFLCIYGSWLNYRDYRRGPRKNVYEEVFWWRPRRYLLIVDPVTAPIENGYQRLVYLASALLKKNCKNRCDVRLLFTLLLRVLITYL